MHRLGASLCCWGDRGPRDGGARGVGGTGMGVWVHSGVRGMAGVGNAWMEPPGWWCGEGRYGQGTGWVLEVTGHQGKVWGTGILLSPPTSAPSQAGPEQLLPAQCTPGTGRGRCCHRPVSSPVPSLAPARS